MLGGMSKVFVGCEKRQIVPDGKLRKQRINRADLNARLTACVSQGCCTDVIISIRLQQRQGGKSVNDLGLCLRAGEALQKLLKDQARGDYDIGSEQRILEFLHLRFGSFDVAAKSQ